MLRPTTATPTAPKAGVSKGQPKRIVNDFTLEVATVNGSGSQSSNNVLMRSIFYMGIPVGGKNIFPSNIAGLPTWFSIRASKDGYVARKKEVDVLIAMNTDTVVDDAHKLQPGGVFIYHTDLHVKEERSDVIYYGIPFRDLVRQCCPEARLQRLVVNMIYVGVAAQLFGIDLAAIERALRQQFKTKQKVIDLNLNAIRAGVEYTRQNVPKRDGFYLERMNGTEGKIIIEGNAACALGAVFGGCTVYSWYPITPSSSLGESVTDLMRHYRTDPKTGKAMYAVVQAEDELAALGMAIGAGWAGARAMTATSGPGLSLMAEFAGLAYFAEIPVVIVDVQRIGPSTGLPTRTSQGDILEAAFLSHGDTQHILLFPATMEECFTMTMEALDLAERFQTPVLVMSDLDLGMNNWMSEPFAYPTKPFDRGKVLTKEQLEQVGKFERYRDVEGDGVPYRTLPGTPHPLAPYFTRGSGHNEKAQYTERGQDYKSLMDRLVRKFETARAWAPKPIEELNPKAEIGIIAFGSSHCAVVESRDQLRKEGVRTSTLRLRAYPFHETLKKFVERHKRIYVVEQNRDAQMCTLIRLAVCGGEECEKLRSVLHYTGIPIDARFITDSILACERGKAREAGNEPVETGTVGGE